MYSNNLKISLRQLKRLLVFDIFSVGIIVVPRIVAGYTGYDGIPAIIIGVILAFLYAVIMISFVRHINGAYLDYSEESVGKVVTFLFSLLY